MARALTRAEEKRVDMYEALTDAAVYEEAGAWVIESPDLKSTFSTAEELMEDVEINLECIRERMSDEEIMDALEQMGYNLEEEDEEEDETMRFEEMTRNERQGIARRGGDEARRLNEWTGDQLDKMDLSETARQMIAETDWQILYECFGEMTAEEIEEEAAARSAYSIVDNEGNVYASDIQGRDAADSLLASITDKLIEEDGMAQKDVDDLEIEIIEQ